MTSKKQPLQLPHQLHLRQLLRDRPCQYVHVAAKTRATSVEAGFRFFLANAQLTVSQKICTNAHINTCNFCLQKRLYKTVEFKSKKFTVDIRYEKLKPVGKGAYGVVCSAKDSVTNKQVAIKKVEDVFVDLVDAKRILREVKVNATVCMGIAPSLTAAKTFR